MLWKHGRDRNDMGLGLKQLRRNPTLDLSPVISSRWFPFTVSAGSAVAEAEWNSASLTTDV